MTAVQTEYSLWTRDPEDDGVLATCAELGIGFVAYSPIGRGFLSGQIRSVDDLAPDDFRRRNPRSRARRSSRTSRWSTGCARSPTRRASPRRQLALAWVMAQSDRAGNPAVVPIPGTKRVAYLEENAAAADVELTDDDLRRLDEAAPAGAAGATATRTCPPCTADPRRPLPGCREDEACGRPTASRRRAPVTTSSSARSPWSRCCWRCSARVDAGAPAHRPGPPGRRRRAGGAAARPGRRRRRRPGRRRPPAGHRRPSSATSSACVLVPVAGVLWARTERTRWAGTVLAVAGAVVGVMVWRLLQLWEATGA